MSKVTFFDVKYYIREVSRKRNLYVRSVSQSYSRGIMTITLAKLTDHGLRTVGTLTLELQKVEAEDWGKIYNYYMTLSARHRKITKG